MKEQEGKGSNWPRQLDWIEHSSPMPTGHDKNRLPGRGLVQSREHLRPPVRQARREKKGEREIGGEFVCECSCCVQCGCGSRGTRTVPPPKIISLVSPEAR